ncbi:ANL family adenylate-forming protein [Campylobacter lari]|uniref:ANL family adenylate-forming protein n=1 Tax=Campylobacter lari TaxID=201 RepID=UPI000E1817D8|nr:class I adenylate-forming enzyme family protein [Campylobacter lari]SUX05513.1 AMP-dependent synthetase and ligase [Campylobacter lari]
MDKFKNVFLNKVLNENQEQYALIYENMQYTYKDLSKIVHEKIQLLNSIGNINLIGIVGDYDIDSIALFLACIELNKIIIPFINESEINNKLTEVNCDILFKNNQYELQKKHCNNHDLIQKLIDVNKPGLILFSSGSTGKPKAMVHDLTKILQNMNYSDKKNKTIALFLPDHVAGIDVLLKTLSSNSSLIIPNTRDSERILKLIELFKVNIMPASPSMLRLLLLCQCHKYDLKSLEVIAYGSERLDDALLFKLKGLFPNVYFKQNFGTSETFSFQTKNHKEKQSFFKILNINYKIINNELFLKSDTQSLGYLNADNSVFTDDGYFATGDLVEVINENGEEYIKIIGRNKEVINVGGEKVLPQEVEGILMQMPFIQDCLVYGQNNPLTGQSVCVKIVLEQNENFSTLEAKKKIRMFCKDKLANYKIPTKVEIVQRLEISSRFKRVRL